MKEVNSIYNITTDYNTTKEFINEHEIDWEDIKDKIYCIKMIQDETVEEFINEKNYNPLKVNGEEVDSYYLIDKNTKASNAFKHQILSFVLVTKEIYEKELSKLNDKPKTKVKR